MRRSKYGATRCTVDGETFDSKREAARWQELRLLERAGEIRQLERQPRFPLIVHTTHPWSPRARAWLQPVEVGEYRADFRYVTKAGETVIEDAKGVRTPVYRLKKRMVEATYGVTIQEV